MLVLGIAMIGWFVYRYIPAILCCFFPDLIKARILNPSDSSSLKHNEDVQQLTAELSNLGFVPLGSKIEKRPLWGRESKDVSLVSPRHKCFASISLSHSQPVTYFYTPLSDDGAVLTASALFPNISSRGYRVVTCQGRSAAQLLEVHSANVTEFEKQGYRTWDDWSPAARVQATYHYYALPATRQYMRKMGLIASLLFAVGIVLGVTLVSQGLAHRAPRAQDLPDAGVNRSTERQHS